MEEAIRNFPNQLKFKPIIENSQNLFQTDKFIVSGMGGSHLAADLIKSWDPNFDIAIHHNYGLPGDTKGRLIVISSYSGNTEEALDGFKKAMEQNLPVACISIGGELLELARKFKKPYIQMPDTGIEPRSALGFSIVSLLKLFNQTQALAEIERSADDLNMDGLEKIGKSFAAELKDEIPIIYSSEKNFPIACNWKIRFNETGKIPAFCNSLPELNHNEMVGFDGEKKTKKLLKNFYFIFLKEKEDHPRILLRMDILKEIFEEKGFPVQVLDLKGKNIWEKMFSSLSLADWTAFYIAKNYGLKAQETEIISRFKNTIKEKGGKL